jgi:hypothetical protein
MKRLLAGLGALLMLAGAASAQAPVVTWSKGIASGVSGNASSTITGTGTFQSLWASNALRNGCTVQNNGSHTMYVFFGPIASATEGLSVELAAGQSVNCQFGGLVLQDQVSITGTSGDAFYANQQ